MEASEKYMAVLGGTAVLGYMIFTYSLCINAVVAACFDFLGGPPMSAISFVTLLVVCITTLGAVAAVCFTLYKMKALGIDAARQERLDKFDRELLVGKKDQPRTMADEYAHDYR